MSKFVYVFVYICFVHLHVCVSMHVCLYVCRISLESPLKQQEIEFWDTRGHTFD